MEVIFILFFLSLTVSRYSVSLVLLCRAICLSLFIYGVLKMAFFFGFGVQLFLFTFEIRSK